MSLPQLFVVFPWRSMEQVGASNAIQLNCVQCWCMCVSMSGGVMLCLGRSCAWAEVIPGLFVG
jgi:hypothetical protein